MTPGARKYDATDWGSDTDTPQSAVTLKDVEKARKVLKPFLPPTPLLNHPVLTQRLGTEAYVKLENMQQIGAFKIRGAINLLASMDKKSRAKGIVTATRGNYGAGSGSGVCNV